MTKRQNAGEVKKRNIDMVIFLKLHIPHVLGDISNSVSLCSSPY